MNCLPDRQSAIDLVIFDCDGVLVDSESIACRIVAGALSRAGYVISAEEVARRFCGMRHVDQLAIIEGEWGRKLPAGFTAEIMRLEEEALARELTAIPGIHDALAAITLPVCVASSSRPERIAMSLRTAGLYARLAPHLFSATMVAHGKPAPDLFLLAAARMGAAPTHCAVIEDSLPGIRAGKAAGMRVLGFAGGAHCGAGHGDRLKEAGAATVFDDMARLPELLRSLDLRT